MNRIKVAIRAAPLPPPIASPPDRMSGFNNIETANVIWVFAKWGVTPQPSWLVAFSSQLQQQLLSLQPPELCSVLWAAAMLGLQLPNPVLDALLLEAQVCGCCGSGVGWRKISRRSVAARGVVEKKLQEVGEEARYCMGGVLQNHKPPCTATSRPLPCAQVKFVGFTGQGLGTLSWSLARLDIRPKPMWLQV